MGSALQFRRLMREPLIHFAVIGVGVFLLFPGESDRPSTPVIEVGQPVVDRLAAQFEATWNRAPTETELAGLIESHVRDEILYREALALGLDRDDPVIRQRMRLKMEYFAEAAAAATDPGDAVLAEWYAANTAEFVPAGQLSFDQVMLDGPSDAGAVLAALAEGADFVSLGRATILPARIEEEPAPAVDSLFGQGFFAVVAALPQGQWSGPVESAFGLHLVRLDSVVLSEPPPLAEVRERVLNAWRAAEARALRDRQYEALRSTYEVRLAGAAP